MPVNVNVALKAYSRAVLAASGPAFARLRPFVSDPVPANTPGMSMRIPVKGVNPVLDWGETPSATVGHLNAPRGTNDTNKIDVEVAFDAKISGDFATFIDQQEFYPEAYNQMGVDHVSSLLAWLTGKVKSSLEATHSPAMQELTLPLDSATLTGAALAARIRRMLATAGANAPALENCYLLADPVTYERLLSVLLTATNGSLANAAVTGEIGRMVGFKGIIEIPGDVSYISTQAGIVVGHRIPSVSEIQGLPMPARTEIVTEPTTGIRILNAISVSPGTLKLSYSSIIMAGAGVLTRSVNLDSPPAAKGVYQLYKIKQATA